MFKVVGPLDPEKDHFVGRTQELTRMSNWVKSAETYGLVLGARQMGKTSLLYKFQADLQSIYTCVYLDLQPFSDLDQSQVYRYLCEQIVTRLRDRLEKKEWPQADDGLAFIRFLKQLSENIEPSRIVLLLDEMDALSQQSLGSLANTIRGIFHRKMEEHALQKFVFIYAAATDVLTRAERQGSPLRNITECLYLEDLSRSETSQVLEYGFAQEGIQIEEAIADHIYGWTHGHPYLTQALGNRLVKMKQQREDLRITETSVDEAVQLLQTKGDPNLRHVVNALERAKRESPALLEKVQDILGSRVKIRFSRTDPETLQLELMGIVREGEDGYCTIRNQIYQHILQDIRDAVTELAEIKAELDRSAQEYAKRSLWLYFGILAAMWLGLVILTGQFGWNKMEPWTFFIGGGVTLGSYTYFVITQRELSPNAIYDQIVESKKRKIYQASGFDLERYERLVK
jgi:AAA+ ATPase superfamily predicted ATPase